MTEEHQIEEQIDTPPAPEDNSIEAAVAKVNAMEEEDPPPIQEEPPVQGDPRPEIDEVPDKQTVVQMIAEAQRLDRRNREDRRKFTEEKATHRAELEEARRIIEASKNDPMSLLLNSNVDIAAIIEQNLSGEKKSEPKEDPIIKELQEFKKKYEESERQKEINRQHGVWYQRIYDAVKDDPERYEAVLERVKEGSMHDIYEVLDSEYRRTEVLPDMDDILAASDLAEKTYRQEEANRIERYKTTKRHAGLFGAGDPKAKPPVEPKALAATPPPKPVKTLSNDIQRDAPRKIDESELDDDGRFALAIERVKERGKSL